MFKLKSLIRFLMPVLSFDSGGGGGGPAQTTTVNTNIPEYARPYVETMLGATQKELFNTKETGGVYDPNTGTTSPVTTEITGIKGYNPFSRDMNAYFAGPSPLQQEAYKSASDMQVAPQNQMATQLAATAGLGALGAQYNPAQFANQYQAPEQYQSGQFGAPDVNAQRLRSYQMGPAQQVGIGSITQPGAVQDYMSPYMQNVVDIQQREAQRQADIAGTQRGAAAVKSGAFGGSRQAVMDAEAARNLALQKGDIQATGQQAAFQNAQSQFNTEQQARLQAALANQQAGLTTGQANLNAALGVQSLGAGQNLQAQQLNQAARLQAQQAAEQSRQYGYGQNMTAAQLQAQYGLSADQAAEASRQFSANYGMQGLSTGLNAANQLGTLGQNQYGQQTGLIGLQNQLGTQQQQLEQNKINQQIQNYATEQQWGMQQLSNMNAMLRGLPLQTTSTQSYQAAPSTASQLAGLGTAAYGASKLAGAAKGGATKDIQKRKGAGLMDLAISKWAKEQTC